MKQSITFLLLFTLQTAFSQPIKVIGYLPTYRLSWLNSIEFDRLTHVNISFANPDAQGNFSCEGVNITPAVIKAHQKGCKVFISIAGGYLTPEWDANWNTLTTTDNRPAFITKIVQYVLTNNFDGVDVDLEWNYVKDWYSPFILDLKAALATHNKILTVALPGGFRYPQITDEALMAFDWVNIMVYDLTGPWDSSNPGQHSPYSWSQDCIQYWKSQGLEAQKLTLGVPFYGYDFGVNPVNSFTYRGILAENIVNAQFDQSGQKYWNGIPTIKAKTQLAINEVGGIMIWEIGEDAFGTDAPYSLLRAIDEVVDAAVVSVNQPSKASIQLFPNPVQSQLWVRCEVTVEAQLQIHDAQGRLVFTQKMNKNGLEKLEIAHLEAGMYVVSVFSGKEVFRGRFVKI
jgi:chitinase